MNQPELIAIEHRIVTKVDMNGKNRHTFSSGLTIVMERNYNNLDKKHTAITQGEVVDGGDIPKGSIILFHHNASHPVNQLYNISTQLSGEEFASDIRFFAIPEAMCFAHHDGESWKPMNGYEFGLRVFRPHIGLLQGVAPKWIKDVQYITTGKYAGKIIHTLRACDYELIFNDFNGQEKRLVRCRHFDNEHNDREELIAINHKLTKEVSEEKVWVGLNSANAKPVRIWKD